MKILQFKSMAMADYIMHNKIRTKCDIHLTLMAETFIKKHTCKPTKKGNHKQLITQTSYQLVAKTSTL